MLSTRPGSANPGSEPWRDARRILVIRLGALGDVVRTRFAFAGLRARFPEARIDWLVEDGASPGLAGIVGLDGVIEVPRRSTAGLAPWHRLTTMRGVAVQLRERDYDLSVDFHSILKSALMAREARIPVRVGYSAPFAREGASRLMTHHTRPAGDHVSRFERNAALVRLLGGDTPSRPPPLELPADADEGLEELPAEFAVIHPGTSPGTEYKRWETERHAEVARSLYRELGLPTLVTWGPVQGELEAAERVVAGAGPEALLAPRTKSVAAVLALLRRARIFIGSDSGPIHLASLVDLPLVVLFGPTDPVENAPFGGVSSRVIREDVGCNPCREGCPARTCMTALAPDRVVAAVRELLAGPTA
jgi:ADP-heptose:LPS heptosyltransferase